LCLEEGAVWCGRSGSMHSLAAHGAIVAISALESGEFSAVD
jgi:hypothetical protein